MSYVVTEFLAESSIGSNIFIRLKAKVFRFLLNLCCLDVSVSSDIFDGLVAVLFSPLWYPLKTFKILI